jgi:hypothetical protein
MRNRARPLLAVVLTVGSLATVGAIGAITVNAGPALAACPVNSPCPGPTPTPPKPPPITVAFSTSGLVERDEGLTNISAAQPPIQIGAKESFTISASSSVPGATVGLGGEDKYTCVSPSGVSATFDYIFVPAFIASPDTRTRQPFSCSPGDVLTTGTYDLFAEAKDASGTVIGRTPTQYYEFTPQITLGNVIVPESSYGVDTGLILLPGDTVTFAASGQIWAGVLLTETNGPDGWLDYASNCDPKFPLVCAPPYGLIGYLDNDGGYFYIGAGGGGVQPSWPTLAPDGSTTNEWPDPPLDLLAAPTHLMLRTNDDTPGNGSGAFHVNITIDRDNQF